MASVVLQGLTRFFGWCVVLQIIALCASVLVLLVPKNPALHLHARLCGIAESDLPAVYVVWLGQFELFCTVFFIVPYISLKIIA